MISRETHEVERKIAAILKVLSDSAEPLGSRIISRRLRDQGVDLSERAVRYHLKLMDERGLTHCMRQRDGRSITQPGLEELRSALVCDKIGFVTSRIELLAYLTIIDMDEHDGKIPVDVTLFPKREFNKAMDIMTKVFDRRLSVSSLVAVGSEGEKLGGVFVPQGKVGFVTVSSVVINGAFLKAGIPITSRFGGILQVRNNEPFRFVDLIEYDGSTLDPSEIFIAGNMTDVGGVTIHGVGKILASFHEIPMPSKSAAVTIIERLDEIDLCDGVVVGKPNSMVCEMPARSNNIGLLLLSGLNPVAAVVETGIQVVCKTMSGVMDLGQLKSFREL